MDPKPNNQEAFISHVRTCLGRTESDVDARRADLFTDPAHLPPDQQEILDRIRTRDREGQLALLDRLIQEGKPLNLQVVPVKDAAAAAAGIADLVAQTPPEWGEAKRLVQWDHPLVRELDLASALADQQVPVTTAVLDSGPADPARARIRKEVEAAYVGVTSADYCLADTATLVMTSKPGEARSVSLVPSVHVGVIRLDQLLFDLKELYALLKWDPDRRAPLPHHLVFVSGPSKTGDIELVMVHGAHGPRTLVLYVITG